MSQNAGSDARTLVLQATDIVELVGQSVALKRRGKSFVGLCPFHQEKSPSFHVDSAKQFFHCFGCKASGNAIDFVIKRDRLEFIDALKMLAQRAGIDLPRFGGADKQKASERAMMYDAHSAACVFFENQMSHPETGKTAREYLAGRGFTPEILKQFQVGLALDAWDALAKSPELRKYPPGILATAGLLKPRNNGDGHYDTFRNRIMFPIFEEAQARIIAFGGRKVPGSEDPAKYLNSPETPLFSKSKCVYGLNFARQRMIETGTAVIVEGYTDVIMAHQFGVTNVVSILGTAMTEQHVNLLKRFAEKRIVFLFDADEAGDTAADRSVELFLTRDVEICIASLPQGIDPDEFLMKDGAQALETLVAQAPDVLSYKWQKMSQELAENGDITSQQKAVESYLELLASARGTETVNEMRWGAILARVSRLTGMPIDDLHRKFRKRPAERPKTSPPPFSPQASGNTTETEPPATIEKLPAANQLAERQILGILLAEPSRWHQLKSTVHPEDFAEGNRRILAEMYWQHQQDLGEPVFSDFLGQITSSTLKSVAVELLEAAQELANLDETLNGALGYFEEQRRHRAEQKHLAEVRRITGQSASPAEQAAKWAEFVKNNPVVDPRRLGPIRRSKPSS